MATYRPETACSYGVRVSGLPHPALPPEASPNTASTLQMARVAIPARSLPHRWTVSARTSSTATATAPSTPTSRAGSRGTDDRRPVAVTAATRQRRLRSPGADRSAGVGTSEHGGSAGSDDVLATPAPAASTPGDGVPDRTPRQYRGSAVNGPPGGPLPAANPAPAARRTAETRRRVLSVGRTYMLQKDDRAWVR